jgi:hypothetical protein
MTTASTSSIRRSSVSQIPPLGTFTPSLVKRATGAGEQDPPILDPDRALHSSASAGAADRSYLPIAGDSAPAKAAVTEFIGSIGYSVVDAGPLVDSWRQATGTPVWGTPYGPFSYEKGQPVGEDAVRAALAIATR